MKISKTRRILLSSFIAILFSLLTFTFTTFAWFSDRVSSSDNIITVGNLDAEMYWTNDIESNDWHNIEDKKYNAVFTHDNYEPGYTELKYLKIVNTGSLSFKYDLSLLPVGKIGKLAEVVDVYYMSDVTSKVSTRGLLDSNNKGTIEKTLGKSLSGTKVLLPRNTYDGQHTTYETIVAIALKMQTTAGNKYQGESIGDGFSIRLKATQYSYEEDSFDKDYDQEATWPNDVTLTDEVTTVKVENVGNKVAKAVTMVNKKGDVSANIPAGVSLEPGVSNLSLSVTPVDESKANISFDETEAMLSMDVHIEGVADDNEVVMEISLGAVLPKGLNLGNYRFYHVEDKTYQMRLLGDNETPIHNSFKYDPATGDVVLYLKSFSEVAAIADTENAWEGNYDYTWYTNVVLPVSDTTEVEYTIANADQLAGFGAIVGGIAIDGNGAVINRDSFNGKTVKLIADINLGDKDNGNTNLIFHPIGYYYTDDKNGDGTKGDYYSTVYSFEGAFNGNGHTISNFYQNTWEIKGDYDGNYYSDAMGLFGYVVDATIMNLHVDNFSSDGEFTPTGVIAAYALNSTFENIAITECNPRVYNTGNGGIVGIAGNDNDESSNMLFKNITVDNTNKISALWGSWDVACGGLIGMYRGTSAISFVNCHVAAQIDVYNDVCGNYQYYWYRYSGMMIGSIKKMVTDGDGYTTPDTEMISAEGCTVHFGDWNNYYYCELVANSLASYTHDHQFSRLTEVDSIDVENKKITINGKEEEIPSSGRYNYVVVNGIDATKNATCYHFVDGKVWNHEDAEKENVNGEEVLKEDKQHIYLPFNQVFQGYGWGVKHIPVYNGDDYAFEGITILDRAIADSEVKFVANYDNIIDGIYNFETESTITIGTIFTEKSGISGAISSNSVMVTVSPIGENSTVYGEFIPAKADDYSEVIWQNGEIKLYGVGEAIMTITDYNYCMPTTINISVNGVEKFETKFTNDFIYRIGNKNSIELGSIFTAKSGTTIDNSTVEVTMQLGDASKNEAQTILEVAELLNYDKENKADWTKYTLDFNDEFTGIITLTIKEKQSKEYNLVLEVVDAVNATSATSAKANNVVLLNDCNFSTIEVSGGYTLYGNGFKMTALSDIRYHAMNAGFVTLNNGVLDNVQIVCPNFSHSIIYTKNISATENQHSYDSNSESYGNVRSAVMVDGNSKIINSYIHGGRAAIFLRSGNLLVDNSTISGGAAANIHAISAQSLTLRDITLIQKPFTATVHDTSKTLMGFSGLFECDESGKSTPLTLEGTLIQDAWINESYKQYTPSDAESIINNALTKTDYLHDLDDEENAESLNLGFCYIPQTVGGSTSENVTDNRSNKNIIPYAAVNVGSSLASAKVYSYNNSNGTSKDFVLDDNYVYTPTAQGVTSPTISFTDATEDRVFETVFDTSDNRWESSLTVNLDNGNYEFSFDKLLVQKHGADLTYTVTANNEIIDTSKVIYLTSSGVTEYVLTISDGNSTHTAYFILTATKTSIPDPVVSDTTGGTPLLVVKSKGGDWSCAIPALEGIKVKYYTSANNSVTLDLATLTPTSTGQQNGTNNFWTTSKDGYTLKVTCGYIHDTKQIYGMPVVVNNNGNKMYFTISSTNGYVSTTTASRTVTLTYEFTDPNGKTLTFSKTWQFNYADYKNGTQYSYSDFVKGNLKAASSCVTSDTLVTLADGSQARINEVKNTDQILVWDFVKGEYTTVSSSIIKNHGYDNYNIVTLRFEDGTVVKTINGHGFFNKELNKFVIIDENNVSEFVGHKFVKDADSDTTTKLVSYEIHTEYTESWSILTSTYYNCLLEGMLTVTSAEVEGSPEYLMPYELGTDMKYDSVKMEADIEKYGLYTYGEFADYISEEVFEVLGLAHFKVSVGKGYITYEEILYLLEIHFGE